MVKDKLILSFLISNNPDANWNEKIKTATTECYDLFKSNYNITKLQGYKLYNSQVIIEHFYNCNKINQCFNYFNM